MGCERRMNEMEVPSWLTETGFWAFVQLVADSSWALMTLGVLLGAIIAIWVSATYMYKKKTTRTIIASLLTAFVVITWATVMNKVLNGLLWPYVILAALWVVLGMRWHRAGFIIGLLIFYGFTISAYVWPEFWLWAESW